MLKNRFLLFALFLMISRGSFAQQFHELNTFTQRINAAIDLAAGQLDNIQIQVGTVITDLQPQIKYLKRRQKPNFLFHSPEITDIQLQIENGELILDYRLPLTEEKQYYLLELAVTLDGEAVPLHPEDLKGDIGRAISSSGDMKRIVWTDLLENNITLKGDLEIILRGSLWGIQGLPYKVTCGVAPEFGFQQQLPYYIGAGAGVAAIGLGQIFRSKRNDTYQTYLDSETLEEAQPFFEKSNGHHHTYLILTWSGVTVLTVDAVLYFFRRILHIKRLQVYQEFCNGASLTLQPVMEAPGGNSLAAPDGQAGMQLTIRF